MNLGLPNYTSYPCGAEISSKIQALNKVCSEANLAVTPLISCFSSSEVTVYGPGGGGPPSDFCELLKQAHLKLKKFGEDLQKGTVSEGKLYLYVFSSYLIACVFGRRKFIFTKRRS